MLNLFGSKKCSAAVVAIMTGVLSVLGLTGCLSPQEQFSQQLKLDAGEVSDLSLAEIIEKMHNATDPKNAFANAKSYEMRQSLESTKTVGQGTGKDVYVVENQFKAPDMLRITSIRDSNPFAIVVFNQDRAWNVSPFSNRFNPIAEGTGLNLVKAFTSMLKPGVTVDKIFPRIDVRVVVQDRVRYYRLDCYWDDPNIAPYVMYVDAKTFLTKKLETILYASDGSSYLYQAISEDYVWIHNIRFPSITIVKTGKQTDISKLNSFELNPELPDSLFCPPPAATWQQTP